MMILLLLGIPKETGADDGGVASVGWWMAVTVCAPRASYLAAVVPTNGVPIWTTRYMDWWLAKAITVNWLEDSILDKKCKLDSEDESEREFLRFASVIVGVTTLDDTQSGGGGWK